MGCVGFSSWKNGFISDNQLVGSLMDLFSAGTETTATTILWTFVFMLENPDVMTKIQQEIDNNVGRDRMLTSVDRSTRITDSITNITVTIQRLGFTVFFRVPQVSCHSRKRPFLRCSVVPVWCPWVCHTETRRKSQSTATLYPRIHSLWPTSIPSIVIHAGGMIRRNLIRTGFWMRT